MPDIDSKVLEAIAKCCDIIYTQQRAVAGFLINAPPEQIVLAIKKHFKIEDN
jgi:hypothetical protein